MLLAALSGLLAAMALLLVRLLRGPSAYDRILAANAFGTKTVLLIAVLGFATGRPDFLDVAIVYALINFISVIGIMKALRHGSLGARISADAPPGPEAGR